MTYATKYYLFLMRNTRKFKKSFDASKLNLSHTSDINIFMTTSIQTFVILTYLVLIRRVVGLSFVWDYYVVNLHMESAMEIKILASL